MYVLETKRKERTQLYKTIAWLNVGCEISHELKQSNLKKNLMLLTDGKFALHTTQEVTGLVYSTCGSSGVG